VCENGNGIENENENGENVACERLQLKIPCTAPMTEKGELSRRVAKRKQLKISCKESLRYNNQYQTLS